MRQMYSSPRIENVDRVAQWFAEHGIATRITNDGGWRGRSHRRFSYFGSGRERANWPQLWVLKADDQPRARALLREIGIKPAVRYGEELDFELSGTAPIVQRRRRVVTRIRLALLAAIAAIVLVTVLHSL